MTDIIRVILYTIIVGILLIGGCTQFLWYDYTKNRQNPCTTEGEFQNYSSIQELAPQGSNYGAMCGGYTSSGRYISYQARGR